MPCICNMHVNSGSAGDCMLRHKAVLCLHTSIGRTQMPVGL